MIKFCKKCQCDTVSPEICKAIATKYRLTNPEKVKLRTLAWRAANPEKRSSARVAYRAANIERERSNQAAYRVANPDRHRVHNHNRRARILANGGKLSAGIVQRLLKLQRGKCACCGLPLGNNYHLDHIMPLALGGSNCDQNMQILHQRCNTQKQAKHPIDFMQERGFLL